MFIIESYKEIIIDKIKSEIVSTTRVCIPEAVDFINTIPALKQELLNQYNTEICNGRSFTEYGIPERTALMQAALNDTVIIGENHLLYSNCLIELLGVSEKHKVNAKLTRQANIQGKCRAYQITKTHTQVMENDTGLVRTRETFTEKSFWLYSVFRSYMEFLLIWAQEKGILIKGSDGSQAGISFNDTIKTRFSMPIQEWDLLHNRLDSFDDIFDARRILKDSHGGMIKAYTSNKKMETISFLQAESIIPLPNLEAALRLYGSLPTPAERMLIQRAILFFQELQPGMEKPAIPLQEQDEALIALLHNNYIYKEDYKMLSRKSDAFKAFIQPFDKLAFKTHLPADQWHTLPAVLKKNAVYMRNRSGYAGLYTTSERIMGIIYGKGYEAKENERDRLFRKYVSNETLLKRYAAETEMGGNGYSQLCADMNRHLTYGIHNIFNGSTLKVYDLMDCYRNSKESTPLYIEYIDLNEIVEVIVCDI